MAGEIINVKDGFGQNYLVPRKLGVEVTEQNEQQFATRIKHVEHRKEVIASKTSMLAEKIKSLTVELRRKTHDDNKLFGAITPCEIVDALAHKGVSVSKSQVDFGKSIKTTGSHEVKIKLSSKLQPTFTVVIKAEKV
jgi:large subunit ribosomal protein L9